MTDRFVPAEDHPSGKRAACVAGMLELLVNAEGEPVPWDEMNDEVGMDHHGQLMPAFHALEMVGAVVRYTYVDDNGTRPKPAFAIAEGVELVDDAIDGAEE